MGMSRATDRERKIALHAKAKREAEGRYGTADGIQDMSVMDKKRHEPMLALEVKGKGTKGGLASVHAQRFDNIFSAPQTMEGNFVAPVFEKSDEDVEFLLDALADNFVFNTLDEFELETLVNAFENYEVHKGEVIIRQGDMGGHFYIVYRGQVAFVVDGNEVVRAEAGSSFGEWALLYNAPRAATCIAIDGGTKVVLRKVPFLSDLDDEFMNRIADALTTVHYEAGEVIFERGSEGSVFYVIQEGKVEYEHKKRGIKVLGPGDYFGEQAIVKNKPRRADATAVKDMFMLALSRDAPLSERFLGPLTEVTARVTRTWLDMRMLSSNAMPFFVSVQIFQCDFYLKSLSHSTLCYIVPRVFIIARHTLEHLQLSEIQFIIPPAQVHAGTFSHIRCHLTDPITPTIEHRFTEFDILDTNIAIPYSRKFAVFVLLLWSGGQLVGTTQVVTLVARAVQCDAGPYLKLLMTNTTIIVRDSSIFLHAPGKVVHFITQNW
ncbi:hypothetical protein ACHAXA_008774 [Cyclostephanos tholiformis]|uniref:Cyclic nucleotide-binding domain-containing protein n=1 Tax=Cyclostephanos tholiformis TaxID=382380 RepID=A0ABD3R6V8_9STRA